MNDITTKLNSHIWLYLASYTLKNICIKNKSDIYYYINFLIKCSSCVGIKVGSG